MENEQRKMLFDAAVSDITKANEGHCETRPEVKMTPKEIYICAMAATMALEGAMALDGELGNSIVETVAMTLDNVLGPPVDKDSLN